MSVRLLIAATALVLCSLAAGQAVTSKPLAHPEPATLASGSRPFKAAFDVLRVDLDEQIATAVRQQRIIKIDGSGKVQLLVESPPGSTVYTGDCQLSSRHLAELEGLLKQTDWLNAPRGSEKPPAPGGRLSMRLALDRSGRTTNARLGLEDKDAAKAYQQLHNLLHRLYRQEELYYEATGKARPDPALRQLSIAQRIGWEIDTLRGGGGGGFVPALDYARLVKPLEGLLAQQEIADAKDVIGALKLVGYVRAYAQWEAVLSLRQRLTGEAQPQATEALLRIGGPRVKEILPDLTPKELAMRSSRPCGGCWRRATIATSPTSLAWADRPFLTWRRGWRRSPTGTRLISFGPTWRIGRSSGRRRLRSSPRSATTWMPARACPRSRNISSSCC